MEQCEVEQADVEFTLVTNEGKQSRTARIPTRGHLQIDKVSDSRERNLRNAIENAPEPYRGVLIEVYRGLVLANFCFFEKNRGSSARAALRIAYPPEPILSGFSNKSGRCNHSGELLYHILVNPASLDYQIAGSILIAGIESGVFDQPRIDARPGTERPLAAVFDSL